MGPKGRNNNNAALDSGLGSMKSEEWSAVTCEICDLTGAAVVLYPYIRLSKTLVYVRGAMFDWSDKE